MTACANVFTITRRPEILPIVCASLGSKPWVVTPLAQSADLGLYVHADIPSVVLVDVGMNECQEMQTITDIRQHHPDVPVIAMGSHWMVASVVKAIKMGAFEVCEFPNDDQRLLSAVDQAICLERHGERKLHDIIPRTISDRLTAGETRILRLMVEGRTTKQVGASLDVSVRTIHYRKKSILQKLGVQNRSEAIELIRLTQGSLATF